MQRPAELLEQMARSLQDWQRALGGAARGGQTLEIGPLVGSIVPAARSRSLPNAAAVRHGAALAPDVLDELADAHRRAGGEVWGVWLHESNRAARAAVETAGYQLDSRPVAMAVELEDLEGRPAPTGVSARRVDDLELLAAPLSAGYGFPVQFLTSGLPGLLGHCQGWVAHVDGTPAAGLVLVLSDQDAGVFMVATAPELRRRGAAGHLVRTALLHARELGATTSTLQSSSAGRSVYSALGYAALGVYELWEHRPAN